MSRAISARLESLSPEGQRLLRLLMSRRGLKIAGEDTIPRAADADSYPPSFSQESLWFLDRMEPFNAFYNEPLLALRIIGPLARSALSRSLDEIVARHESLRTTFADVDGRPLQIISPPRKVPLPLTDLRSLGAIEREIELRRLAIEEASRLFDLHKGPLLRARLLQMEEQDHVVFLQMHHIITDGWSNRLLTNEIALLYDSFLTGKENPLPPLPLRYVDYAIWQKETLQGPALEHLIAFWKDKLCNPPTADLPTDYPRPLVQRYKGKVESVVLPWNLLADLKHFSHEESCTFFMTALSAFLVLLNRYSGQEDFIVGCPVANRNRREIEAVVGFFVNTLAMRFDLSGNPVFTELLSRVKKVAVDAFAHQDLPFEKLVETLRPERSLSRPILYQVLFVLHNYPTGQEAHPHTDTGLTLSKMDVDGEESKVDLAMAVTELPGVGLKVQLYYNTDLFADNTAKRLVRKYENILRGIVARLSVRLNAMDAWARDDGARTAGTKAERVRALLGNLKKSAPDTGST